MRPRPCPAPQGRLASAELAHVPAAQTHVVGVIAVGVADLFAIHREIYPDFGVSLAAVEELEVAMGDLELVADQFARGCAFVAGIADDDHVAALPAAKLPLGGPGAHDRCVEGSLAKCLFSFNGPSGPSPGFEIPEDPIGSGGRHCERKRNQGSEEHGVFDRDSSALHGDRGVSLRGASTLTATLPSGRRVTGSPRRSGARSLAVPSPTA